MNEMTTHKKPASGFKSINLLSRGEKTPLLRMCMFLNAMPSIALATLNFVLYKNVHWMLSEELSVEELLLS